MPMQEHWRSSFSHISLCPVCPLRFLAFPAAVLVGIQNLETLADIIILKQINSITRRVDVFQKSTIVTASVVCKQSFNFIKSRVPR